MWDRMFQPIDMIGRGLEASWMRNAVIRNNIANIETPNFKASTLEFESVLAGAVTEAGFVGTRTHAGHRSLGSGSLEMVTPRIVQQRGLSMRMDGNNVDIESENVRLAENSLFYNTLVEKLNGEIRRLRMAISEGR